MPPNATRLGPALCINCTFPRFNQGDASAAIVMFFRKVLRLIVRSNASFPASTHGWAPEPHPRSRDPQFLLHLLQSDALGFRINEEDNEELQDHHRRKKDKRISAGRRGHQGEMPEISAFMNQC